MVNLLGACPNNKRSVYLGRAFLKETATFLSFPQQKGPLRCDDRGVVRVWPRIGIGGQILHADSLYGHDQDVEDGLMKAYEGKMHVSIDTFTIEPKTALIRSK